MLQFQAVAEKMAKNFRGLLFCCTLYIMTFSFFSGEHWWLRLYLILHYLTLNWEVFEIKCAYTGIQSIKVD